MKLFVKKFLKYSLAGVPLEILTVYGISVLAFGSTVLRDFSFIKMKPVNSVNLFINLNIAI